MDCPFCEIAQENPPNSCNSPTVFYSSDSILAFMDIMPLISSQVHVLVVPRLHFSTVDKLPDDQAAKIGTAVSRVARAIAKIMHTDDENPFAFNVIQNNGISAGQVVHHVHFHIILRKPRYELPESRSKIHTQMHFYARQQREDLDDERMSIVEGLRKELQMVRKQESKL